MNTITKDRYRIYKYINNRNSNTQTNKKLSTKWGDAILFNSWKVKQIYSHQFLDSGILTKVLKACRDLLNDSPEVGHPLLDSIKSFTTFIWAPPPYSPRYLITLVARKLAYFRPLRLNIESPSQYLEL